MTKRLERAAEDLEPLAWLLGFANLGFDDRKPRPPRDHALHSRALGLDGTHKGYAFDPDGARPEIRPDYTQTLEHCEVRTQEFRGFVKRWIRLLGETEWKPSPPRDAAITPDAFRYFLQEWPPRAELTLASRAILPDRVEWFQYGRAADAEHEASAEERQDFFAMLEEVRDLLRSRLLAPLWALHVLRPRAKETISDAEASMHGNLARWVLCYLVAYCTGGWGDMTERRPVEDSGDPVGNPIGYAEHLIERTIWEHRAPVHLEVRGGGRMHWDAIAFPALVWAEVLNACFAWPNLGVIEWPDLDDPRTPDPRWAGLRCCSWCGRYFWETPGRSGPPRAFCMVSCGKKYHEAGFGERRTPRRIHGTPRK